MEKYSITIQVYKHQEDKNDEYLGEHSIIGESVNCSLTEEELDDIISNTLIYFYDKIKQKVNIENNERNKETS